MANLFTKYGMDIGSVFKTGSGKQWLYIAGDDGQDLGVKYLAGTSPFATGFCVPNGQDLNKVLLSDGTTWGTVRRTPGGWDAAVDATGFDYSYLAQRAKILRESWWDTSQFVVCGSSDSMCDETGYYRNATKFFRVDQKTGAPKINNIRVKLNLWGTNDKAWVGIFYVENPSPGVFTFILLYSRVKHGWCCGQVVVYAQTDYGEAPIYSFTFDQP